MYIFIYMKILITESQNNVLWIKRRFQEIEDNYEYVINHFNVYDICDRYETFPEFFNMFIRFLFRLVEDDFHNVESVPEGLEETLEKLYMERIKNYYQNRCS